MSSFSSSFAIVVGNDDALVCSVPDAERLYGNLYASLVTAPKCTEKENFHITASSG